MTTHTYPYTMVDGHLILDCHGKRMLLDTGAPTSVCRAPAFAFAGAEHLADGDYLGIDLDEIGVHVGTRLDGLIGVEALIPYDTVVDPVRSHVQVHEGDHDLEGTEISLDCSMIVPTLEAAINGVPARVVFDTGAKLSYLERALIEGCPQSGTRKDFFPGLGAFTSDTYEAPITLGSHTFTITTGVLSALPAMALALVGAKGILGSALFDHFAVGYSPRRSEMTLARL